MENDLISRQAVLALPRNKVRDLRTYEVVEETIDVKDIEKLSSAQPTQNNTSNTLKSLDYVDRQDDFEKQIHAMFDHIWDCEIDHPVFRDTVGDLMGAVIQCHKGLTSAEPEEIALHESCTDCPLYDKDRHSCPRFNKVIPETLRELQSAQPKKGRWVLHTYMPHVAYCTICERNSPYNRRWDFCPNCGADMRGGEDEINSRNKTC